MPTKTLCERCDAPLYEDLNWCAECGTAPWAPASWTKESLEAPDWPDIWDRGGALELERIQAIRDEEIARLEGMLEPRMSVVWSLRKAVSTVALLVGLATMTAVFVPERVVGLVSLVSLGTIALLVVQRAWVSEPFES
jgi:hypothetical protein